MHYREQQIRLLFGVLYDDTHIGSIQSGLGLHLIRDLAKAINCSIELPYSNTTGTQFLLRFNDGFSE